MVPSILELGRESQDQVEEPRHQEQPDGQGDPFPEGTGELVAEQHVADGQQHKHRKGNEADENPQLRRKGAWQKAVQKHQYQPRPEELDRPHGTVGHIGAVVGDQALPGRNAHLPINLPPAHQFQHDKDGRQRQQQ